MAPGGRTRGGRARGGLVGSGGRQSVAKERDCDESGRARRGFAGSGGQRSAAEERDGDGDGQQGDDAVDYIATGRGLGESVGVASGRAPLLGTKEKNFQPEEERQLTRSVLAISQDPITGNQQKSGAFWNRIHEHYEEHRPLDRRPARSLESKWGLIKPLVTKFVSYYAQVVRLNPTGASSADLLTMAHELFRTKSQNNTDFPYEHIWHLVKNYPRWADGWTTSKLATPSKRKSSTSDQGSAAPSPESSHVMEAQVEVDLRESSRESNPGLMQRPGGSKSAKLVHKEMSMKSGAAYA
jgi:hypothetical protein